MSVNARQARSFIEPLKGKAVTFLVDSREANLSLIRNIVALIATAAKGCAIFDVDAFVSSNSYEILEPLQSDAAGATTICVPASGSDIETEFSGFFRTDAEVLIVESLNSLYHLFSSSEASSRSRKAAFAIVGLSFLARAGGKTGVLIMYRREKVLRAGRGGSIADLSDATVSVEATRSGLLMKCERGKTWPGGEFFLRFP